MESGNEYVLQVKGNQPKLLEAVKSTIANSFSIDVDYTLEKNRGRIEKREVHIYSATDQIIYKQWCGIKNIIHVVSEGIRNKKKYKVNRYYITSKTNEEAASYNKGIRAHWGIENKLHWVKDVILNEDKGMVRDLDRSGNMSIFRNMVLNIYRINGFKSIKIAIERFTNRIDRCIDLICDNLIY